MNDEPRNGSLAPKKDLWDQENGQWPATSLFEAKVNFRRIVHPLHVFLLYFFLSSKYNKALEPPLQAKPF